MTPETLLVRHCAPTLANMKSSSLICLEGSAIALDSVLTQLRVKGVGFRFFTNSYGCRLLFAYRPKKLKAILGDEAVRNFLSSYGYESMDLREVLNHLGKRLSTSEDFPHEIGIFLGYPFADVLSFIENNGQGYLESGIWKIYHNVEEGRRLCKRYRDCTACYLQALSRGVKIEDLCVSA